MLFGFHIVPIICAPSRSGRSSHNKTDLDYDPDETAADVAAAKRHSRAAASLGLNLPATGGGAQRAPSIASNDEGGFNEPSPDIKAKLKPSYSFDPADVEQLGGAANAVSSAHPTATTTTTTVAAEIAAASHPHHQHSEEANAYRPVPVNRENTLHYVDFGYRVNPDGSEIRGVCVESSALPSSAAVAEPHFEHSAHPSGPHQLYNHRQPHQQQQQQHVANGFGEPKESTVLYATIKPEVPPPADLFLELGDPAAEYDVVTHSEDKIYYSPQRIVNPAPPPIVARTITTTTTMLATRADPDTFDDDDDDDGDVIGVQPPTHAHYADEPHADNMYGLEQLPPPRPPLPNVGPLDLHGVEYADAGGETDDVETLATSITTSTAEPVGVTEATADGDIMTADEEERLLSSR